MAVAASPHHFPFKKVLVGTVGTTMEWYDFGVYGFFAAIFGKQFFPATDNSRRPSPPSGLLQPAFWPGPSGPCSLGNWPTGKGAALHSPPR